MLKILNFLHMGGYAAYVWSAYGAATLILVGNLVLAIRYAKKTRQIILQTYSREKKHAS